MKGIQKIGLGAGLLASSLLVSSCHNNLTSAREEAKRETLDLIQKDLSADEYLKIMHGAEEKRTSFLELPNNYQEIQYWDSIRTDALCKKAYLEGAQMVRDSIANANKETFN